MYCECLFPAASLLRLLLPYYYESGLKSGEISVIPEMSGNPDHRGVIRETLLRDFRNDVQVNVKCVDFIGEE
tara:strand:+ start:124 stop:339 length:216 start_codon:yes stop_codon:yes gene_type:complete